MPTNSSPVAATIPAAAMMTTAASLPTGVVWIPAPWQYPDAVVELDSYPMPICPSSSIVQGTLLWGLIGEVLEIKRR